MSEVSFVQMVGREVWVKCFVQMVGTNLGKCEWVWEEILKWLNPRWPNSRWQNSRWLPSSRWVRMNEFDWNWISLSQSFVQNGWIQDGRIQDGCHHQIESEWMSEVILVQMVGTNEWVKFLLCKWWEGKCEWSVFVQMVGTNLGKCEWVWEEKLRWLNPR